MRNDRSNHPLEQEIPRRTALQSPDVGPAELSGIGSTCLGDIPTPDHSIVQTSPAPVLDCADGASRPWIHDDHPETPSQSQQDSDGLGEVNRQTEGSEFYGPTGTFYFLSRLQSQARSRNPRAANQNACDQPSSRALTGASVVNLLHSSDYPVSKVHDHTPMRRQSGIPASPVVFHIATETEIARECVQLYFQNLHCIHPILDREAFLARCESEVWNESISESVRSTATGQSQHRFLALLNAVLGIGAITAGETSMLTLDRTVRFLEQHERREPIGTRTTTYPPIRAARLFFERSKQLLGDIFESSSFETAQTLFLMVRTIC